MSNTADISPLYGLIDIIAEQAAKAILGDMPSCPPVSDLDIRPSHRVSPTFPITTGLVQFRPRWDDFVWGCRRTGDMVCDQGYRIYPAMLEDVWVVVDADNKRLGKYDSLEKAMLRVEARAIQHA